MEHQSHAHPIHTEIHIIDKHRFSSRDRNSHDLVTSERVERPERNILIEHRCFSSIIRNDTSHGNCVRNNRTKSRGRAARCLNRHSNLERG